VTMFIFGVSRIMIFSGRVHDYGEHARDYGWLLINTACMIMICVIMFMIMVAIIMIVVTRP
jgi:hypothetical protein